MHTDFAGALLAGFDRHRRAQAIRDFLLEALLLTAVGGAAGILLGAGVSWLVRALSSLPTFVSPWSVYVPMYHVSAPFQFTPAERSPLAYFSTLP